MIKLKCEIVLNQDSALRIRWCCPLCGHQRDFPEVDADLVCFMAVHHLAKKHSMEPEHITALEPLLSAATKEYFRRDDKQRERRVTRSPTVAVSVSHKAT